MIGVCETPELLEAAVQNLGVEFDGCGRIKNNFAVKDASYMFHLTTILLNVLVPFDCTFAQLAALSDEDVDALQERLSQFPGRIRRDDWVAQATRFVEEG